MQFSFYFLLQSEIGADGHSHRWNSLELVKGSYGPDDLVSDIAEIKFDRPVSIKVCMQNQTWFSVAIRI